MIAPEDVLLETITAILHYGDQPWIRKQQCAKLRDAIYAEVARLSSPPMIRDDGQE